ncbi:spermatogenesis-associated protein 9 isoform X2 [Vulpes lagopus]|uniref:spermatogenesis-associated protein 9 isoform X2 n=1 Tax=Vulpes lagopus TaxID=494514 RepID=UPI001BC8E9D3|nr:spermatogenesis-associated protein 9 isoform X2 [Vulpes lagopus]
MMVFGSPRKSTWEQKKVIVKGSQLPCCDFLWRDPNGKELMSLANSIVELGPVDSHVCVLRSQSYPSQALRCLQLCTHLEYSFVRDPDTEEPEEPTSGFPTHRHELTILQPCCLEEIHERKSVSYFSGKNYPVEGIQKVIMDLIDEFKDEFPTILRLSQSNQKREPMQKTSKIKMAVALAKINRGTLIQGLNSISRSSKSVAKLLQPQLARRLLELRGISHRLLREVNAPKQPLYNMQVRRGSLFEIISFPAKTALISIMYASYAALIYLTVCVNAVLEKIKKIFQEEETIRQNRKENENLRKAFSEPVLSEPTFPEGEIKAKPYRSLPEKPDSISDSPKLPATKLSNKIQVLHSVFDQSAEMNE